MRSRDVVQRHTFSLPAQGRNGGLVRDPCETRTQTYFLCSSWLEPSAAPPRAAACCWSWARRALRIFVIFGRGCLSTSRLTRRGGERAYARLRGTLATNLLELCVRHGLVAVHGFPLGSHGACPDAGWSRVSLVKRQDRRMKRRA